MSDPVATFEAFPAELPPPTIDEQIAVISRLARQVHDSSVDPLTHRIMDESALRELQCLAAAESELSRVKQLKLLIGVLWPELGKGD